MLNSIDKKLLRVKAIDFYETPSVYDSNTTLYGGGGTLGIEKCEKSAIRSNNFGNDCRLKTRSLKEESSGINGGDYKPSEMSTTINNSAWMKEPESSIKERIPVHLIRYAKVLFRGNMSLYYVLIF